MKPHSYTEGSDMKVWKLIKQNPILSVLTALALAAPIAWVAIGTNSLPLIAASFVIYFTFALAVLVPKDEHCSMFKALLEPFLPSAWLFIPFGALLGFTGGCWARCDYRACG